ncbi:MAG: hypothetical protein ACTFAK_13965 [Candidatus Electronema sp. VV]
MFFNHLSYIDKDGIEKDKIGEFANIVFCCIPQAYKHCDPITIDMLELLASSDRKYYAVAADCAIRDQVKALLEKTFGDIGLQEGNDFFVLIKNDSFVKGKPIGLKVFQIEFKQDRDPDEIFVEQFKLLREHISKENIKEKFRQGGLNIIDKILGIFSISA